MKIASVASAFPKYQYSQGALLERLKQHWAPKLENPQLLDRLHATVGVERRYLSLPMDAYEQLTWGQANTAWIETSLDLGQEATTCALARAGFAPNDVSALFFVSITGISSPSIDARLVNRMRLSPNVKRVPIFGLGCVGGAASIARAADYVRAFPDQIAVVLSVELCSLTLQATDLSVANLISSGLFGDGAAAVVIAGSEAFPGGPEILATRSVFYPDTEEVMGWDISEAGFRIVLSRDVPRMVYRHLASDVVEFLADHGLTKRDIGAWIMHTGGPAVLEAMATALELPEGALDASWESLRRVGNLSSASVLLVLEEVLCRRRPPPGTYSVLAAMGPGFCSELVLLQW